MRTLAQDELESRRDRLQRSFSPGAPVQAKDLFAGRVEQLSAVLEAISSRGRHAIVYGERGVGKTSLANIVLAMAAALGCISVRVNCDSDDDFGGIWRKVFRRLSSTEERRVAGFVASMRREHVSLDQMLPEQPSPDDIRRLLAIGGQQTVVILDELDRAVPGGTTRRLADTVKTLSDDSCPATLVLVGVADSVTDLIAEHASVERSLVQVRMPRMSEAELAEILDKGLAQAGLFITPGARRQIVALSQGLPHYTHLLALHAGQRSLKVGRQTINKSDVRDAIRQAVAAAQQSILQLYHDATSSPRPGNLYSSVLLAAAMAAVDRLGYFAAADVRGPIRTITGKSYEIPSFSRHLHDLCEKARGPALQKTGIKRRLRFRFSNPLVQPFVILHGISKGVIPATLDHAPRLKAGRRQGRSRLSRGHK
jgi:Cdc6-like AAA superfamily ATPase